MTATQRLYSCGLRIESDIRLPGVPLDPAASRTIGPDVRIVRAEDTDEPLTSLPEGQLVVQPGSDIWDYAAAKNAAGYSLRFFGQCDVHISADLHEVTCRRSIDATPGLVGVLLAGTTLAFIAMLRGSVVLHASAVEVDGEALAFVGRPGMGKSTLTAAACTTGANLVAEDVLVVEQADGGPRCLPGNTDIRLRDKARSVVPPHHLRDAELTSDGRTIFRPRRTELPDVAISAIVIPLPDPQATEMTVHRLPPALAAMKLLGFPRVVGLCYQAIVERQFNGVSQIATRVPVAGVRVPWGPPFLPDFGRRVRELGSLLDS